MVLYDKVGEKAIGFTLMVAAIKFGVTEVSLLAPK